MDLKSFAQNEKAKNTLLDMVQKKRINHAVLLSGPRGAGKKTFARIMAAATLCEEPTPCFTCSSCHKVLEGIHPDVVEVTQYSKHRSFPIDEVRRIRRDAYVSPNESDKRIFILANLESMGTDAQNALLKIIEEPPPHAMFIMTVQDVGAILPTVLSRVMTIPIAPVDDETCKAEVKKLLPGADVETACAIAQGSIGKAAEILQSEKLKKALETAIDIVNTAVKGDRYETLRVLTSIAQSSELSAILDFMVAILENAMNKKNDAVSKEISSSSKRIMKMLEAVMYAKKAMKYNANKTLLMTHLCVKMYE